MALSPQKVRAVESIPEGPLWQYEPKWDGFRGLIHRDGAAVEIVSKSGQPLARYFPEIVRAISAIDADAFSLDGEIVVPIADSLSLESSAGALSSESSAGALSFDALLQRIHPAASRVAHLAASTPALYLAFDLVRRDGEDFTTVPLAERRRALEAFARELPPGGVIRLSPATTQRTVVDDWFSRVGGALDGVVAKRLDATYVCEDRDAAVKIKKQRTADCVVGGFRHASNAPHHIGSLLLGLYDDGGLLNYVGFCSSFPAAERAALLRTLLPFATERSFTGAAPDEAPSRWNRNAERDRSFVSLRPENVLEVGFDQVTAGRMRHGTKPIRWRVDKSPRSCTVDQLEIAGDVLELLGQ